METKNVNVNEVVGSEVVESEVTESEVTESEVTFPVTDQAKTTFIGLTTAADDASEVAEQTFIASTGIDALEESVREATRQYMRENGFSCCPMSLSGMELLHNTKADYIPRAIAQRIKARCDCHATGKSYKIKVSDLPEYAVTLCPISRRVRAAF